MIKSHQRIIVDPWNNIHPADSRPSINNSLAYLPGLHWPHPTHQTHFPTAFPVTIRLMKMPTVYSSSQCASHPLPPVLSFQSIQSPNNSWIFPDSFRLKAFSLGIHNPHVSLSSPSMSRLPSDGKENWQVFLSNSLHHDLTLAPKEKIRISHL